MQGQAPTPPFPVLKSKSLRMTTAEEGLPSISHLWPQHLWEIDKGELEERKAGALAISKDVGLIPGLPELEDSFPF